MMIEKAYDHKRVEGKIYALWEKSGFFNPDNLPKKVKSQKSKVKNFCVIMPPPNANGSLHLGHAVFVTLQDIIIRYQRMKGKKTLWLPGADHAGFETQVVYDKKLEKEGRNRFRIPRGELYKEIWNFTQTNKKVMEDQLRKLGASCDWSRKTFTLDEDVVKIVNETFVKLYQDGLAYRGLRVVNWCTKHKTSLSDLETKSVEREDPLYYIKYQISNIKTATQNSKVSESKSILLATVRPETMFGDTAVAVNPKDKRYKNLIGATVFVPLVQREVLIIADEAVDPNFGTGAVKVTPAHDAADFEIWQRHKKEIPGPNIVIDENGRLTGDAGDYTGLKVMEARQKIAEEMENLGILKNVDSHYKHQITTCYKCGSTLEPLPKPQWFIRMKPLAKKAMNVVKEKKIRFVPDRAKKIYFHWLKNIRDWNISRQIPWGIRIPAWYCGEMAQTAPKKMGWASDVVSQVLEGKTKTYRLRDHGFAKGDVVAFENSETGIFFGIAVITGVEKSIVKDINLKDLAHFITYKTRGELLAAFKLRNLDKEVSENSPVYIYTYTMTSIFGCGKIIINAGEPLKKCPLCKLQHIVQNSDVFDTWFSSGQWPFAALGYPDKKDYKTFYPTDVMETGYDILPFWVMRMIMLGLYVTGEVPFRTVYLHGLVRDKDRQKMSKSKGNVIDPLGVIDLYGVDALRMALVVGNTPGNDIVISEEKIRGYRNFANKIWNIARFVLEAQSEKSKVKSQDLSERDRKVLKEFTGFKKEITRLMDSFTFYAAAEKLYHYTWHNFADKIIEDAKPSLRSEDKKEREEASFLLLAILQDLLKLLHPFIPYVTEEIWRLKQADKKNGGLLIVEKWPNEK